MGQPAGQAAGTTLEKLQLLVDKGETDRGTFDALAAGLHAQLAGAGAIAQRPGSLAVGAMSVAPCTPEAAQRASGYLIGGTSTFGLGASSRWLSSRASSRSSASPSTAARVASWSASRRVW